MVDKVMEYGYKKIGFILDRGYFSKENIRYIDKQTTSEYTKYLEEFLLLFRYMIKKLNNALMNPLFEKHVMGAKAWPMETATLRQRGAVQIEYREGTVCFRVDGRLLGAQDFAPRGRFCWLDKKPALSN